MAQYNDEHENEYDIRVGDGDLRITGVSRERDNDKCLMLYLSRRPSDDELRILHETFAHIKIAGPTPSAKLN